MIQNLLAQFSNLDKVPNFEFVELVDIVGLDSTQVLVASSTVTNTI